MVKATQRNIDKVNSAGKEDLHMAGLEQGDMSPRVKDFQKPESDFSQRGFSKTLEYIERQDKFQKREADEIEGQSYMGRYS